MLPSPSPGELQNVQAFPLISLSVTNTELISTKALCTFTFLLLGLFTPLAGTLRAPYYQK